jgi:hypothetical protein
MASGDSHTGFDSGAFTAGALAGVSLIASGFAGAFAAARNANYKKFNRSALVNSLRFSEMRRVEHYRDLQLAHRRIGDLQSEIIALRSELKAERARQILLARS